MPNSRRRSDTRCRRSNAPCTSQKKLAAASFFLPAFRVPLAQWNARSRSHLHTARISPDSRNPVCLRSKQNIPAAHKEKMRPEMAYSPLNLHDNFLIVPMPMYEKFILRSDCRSFPSSRFSIATRCKHTAFFTLIPRGTIVAHYQVRAVITNERWSHERENQHSRRRR